MDRKQMEYVQTVAAERSFSKAAKRLFISQPSLSQYISRLEESLGVTLFDRSVNPLTLTHAGEIYLEAVQKITGITDQMQKTFDDMASLSKGKLNVGLTPSKANHPLPSILPVFRKNYPGVELSITEASSTVLEDLLLKGNVDLCIMNLPVSREGIYYEPVFTEKILLAAPPGYGELLGENETAIDIRRVSEEQFILLHPDQRIRQIANSIFIEAGVRPKILLETRSIETAVRLAAAGMGFAFVPEASALYTGLVKTPRYYVIGEPPVTWTLVVAFRESAYVTNAARAFAQVTKEVIGKMYGLK